MKKIVLVADNDEDMRDIVTPELSHAGFDRLGARSAKQALSFLEDIVPCVIVLDFLLVDMDGVALAMAIRSRPSLALVPILMMTRVDRAARERLRQAGLDVRVLAKPLDLAILVDAVQELDGAGGGAERTPSSGRSQNPVEFARLCHALTSPVDRP